jgi:hypothetical protein
LAPLAEKTEEGLAKNVPADRLEQALSQRRNDLRFAAQVVNQSPQTAALDLVTRHEYQTVVLECLNLGLKPDEIQAFVQGGKDAPPAMVFLALENQALLAQMGFPPEAVRRILQTGLAKKAFSPDWRFLFRAVEAARQAGRSDADIEAAVLEAINKNKDLASAMERLGFTRRNMQNGPQTYQSEIAPK